MSKWEIYKFKVAGNDSPLLRPIKDLSDGYWLVKVCPTGETLAVHESEVYFYRDLLDYD